MYLGVSLCLTKWRLSCRLKSGDRFDAGNWLKVVEEDLELLEGDDVKEGHENLGILSCDGVRLSLVDDILLLEHASESALGALHHIDIIGDLEVDLGVGHEDIVLVGGLILVEEDLSGLGATLVISAEEALEVGPGRRIHAVSEVDVIVEGIDLVCWNREGLNNDALKSFNVRLSNAEVVLNGNDIIVVLEAELGVALNDLSFG